MSKMKGGDVWQGELKVSVVLPRWIQLVSEKSLARVENHKGKIITQRTLRIAPNKTSVRLGGKADLLVLSVATNHKTNTHFTLTTPILIVGTTPKPSLV